MQRRKFLKCGLATGAALLGPAQMVHAAGEVQRKVIPSSEEIIPAIGMGSWLTFDVGNNPAAIKQRTDVLRTFFAMGGALIDSSPMYGSSQGVIGKALATLDYPAARFAADKIWTSGDGAGQIETTQARWGIDSFDLLQVHNLVAWERHLETLIEMKARGQVRYLGVTTYAGLKHDQLLAIMASRPLDFVQVTYNILDREVERRILPLARERNIAVIANRPFREGRLFDVFAGNALPAVAAEIGASNWAQFMLKFIISHPDITVTIPATRRVDHMTENMGALLGLLPDAGVRREMVRAVAAM